METERPLNEDEVLAHMGVTLMNVQTFEWLVLQALKQIYADRADLTAERVFAPDKRSLGILIKDLKSKALVSGDIEVLLHKVLDDRNMFAHNLSRQEWFDLSRHEGRERVLEFLMPFSHNLNFAIKFFIALHVKHGDDIGFDSAEMRKIKEDELWRIKELYPYTEKIKKKD